MEDEELLAAARKHLQERKLAIHTGVEDIAKAS
jgi:hypothetical protein